jgi:radical SAM protein with 4Fe4S-binding SPASM domain
MKAAIFNAFLAIAVLALLALIGRGLLLRSTWLKKQRVFYSMVARSTPKRFLNTCLVEIQRLRKSARLLGRPYLAIVEPFNSCNLQCPLCLSGGARAYATGMKRGRMTFETFRRFVDQLGEYIMSMNLFNWGEPLLNKEIFAMISYAQSRNIGVILSTNFQLFDEEMAEKMIRSGLERLIVSIDGATQGTYEIYRVGGDLTRVVEHTKLLVRKKRELKSRYPIIEFQFIVMSHNEHEMDALSELASTLGVDCVNFIAIQIMDEHRENKEKIKSLLPRNKKYRGVELDEQGEVIVPRMSDCKDLWRQTTVDWNGDFYACCLCSPGVDESFPLGNVYQHDFIEEIWNSPYYTSSRQIFNRNSHPDVIYYPKCAVCAGYPITLPAKGAEQR